MMIKLTKDLTENNKLRCIHMELLQETLKAISPNNLEAMRLTREKWDSKSYRKSRYIRGSNH